MGVGTSLEKETKNIDSLKSIVQKITEFYNNAVGFQKYATNVVAATMKFYSELEESELNIINELHQLNEVVGKVFFKSRGVVNELEEHISTCLQILQVQNDMDTIMEGIEYLFEAMEGIIPKIDETCKEMDEAKTKFNRVSTSIEGLESFCRQKLIRKLYICT